MSEDYYTSRCDAWEANLIAEELADERCAAAGHPFYADQLCYCGNRMWPFGSLGNTRRRLPVPSL